MLTLETHSSIISFGAAAQGDCLECAPESETGSPSSSEQMFRLTWIPNLGVLGSVVILGAIVQLLSCVRFFATPWTAVHQGSLSFTISWSLLKLTSIESMMPSNCLFICRPFSSHPQSFPASGSFPVSWLFASGGQSIGASASVLAMNIQGWFFL